ncbi:MAG: hypothetical protein IJ043_07575 [Clostridia bacterium]|nr:hypothetical protein [Clostridia bacterium]
MMMKIFGAVLIVSGGYAIGRIRTHQWEKRLRVLTEIKCLFEDYDRDLREFRRSIEDCFSSKGELAENLLYNRPIKGLLQEDMTRLETSVCRFKSGSFRDSLETNTELLEYLGHTVKKMQEDLASSGKALPLVTGAIGLLIAVLLF